MISFILRVNTVHKISANCSFVKSLYNLPLCQSYCEQWKEFALLNVWCQSWNESQVILPENTMSFKGNFNTIIS